MAVLYANNAASKLSASITNTATSFSVTASTGALFPAISGSDFFYATLMDSSGNLEIVKVTARATDTFTVVRGQDGTTARAYSANDIVELRITKAMLDQFKTDAGNAITSSMVTTALGFTPYNSTNPSGYQTAANISAFFGSASTSGTLDWNDGTNTKPGAYGTLLLGSATNGPGGSNYYHPLNLEYNSKDGSGNVTQMAVAYGTPGNELYMRGRYSATWGSWTRFLNSSNYNSYSPTLTGTGASGTWGISITGNAATATNGITTSNYSSYALPLSGGTLSGGIDFSSTTSLRSNSAFSFLTLSNGAQNARFNGIQVSDSFSGTIPANGILLGTDTTLVRNANTYGSIFIDGARNSYYGTMFNTANGVAGWMTNSTTSGFYNHTFGWKYLHESGNFYIYDGTNGGGTGRITLHAANYNNYSPTLTGGGASGTWGINISGNAASATNQSGGYVSATNVTNDGWYYFNDGVRDANATAWYPNVNTRAWKFFFAGAGNVGTGGNYAGVLHLSPWTGTTASTGDASYQLAFGSTAANGGGNPQLRLRKGIDTTWNSWIDILTSANYSSYALPLSGGTVTGYTYFSRNGTGSNSASTINVLGDITAQRGDTTGSIYLGNSGTKYLYTNGTNYYLNGGELYIGASNYTTLHSNNYSSYALPLSGGTLSGNLTLGSLPSSNTSQLNIGGYNAVGGTGYHGFLAVKNTYGTATNPNKFFRLDSSGTFEVVNSAYNGVLFQITDAGGINSYNASSEDGTTIGSGSTYCGKYIKVSNSNASTYRGVFYDVRNENGVAVGNMLMDINTDGSSSWYWGVTKAGARTSDRRVDAFRIDGNANVKVYNYLFVGGSAALYGGNNISSLNNNYHLVTMPVANSYNPGVWLNTSGTSVGSIYCTGTATAYNTSSDYRLKEDIKPLTGALDRVMRYRPVTFKWKSTGETARGYIAHWLQEDGAPEAVAGVKDDAFEDGTPKYQGVDATFLVPDLNAAIQEQQAIIEQLMQRVAALESTIH